MTGKAKVQQLNCAKGKASTLSVMNNIDTWTDVFILLLPEQWITEKGQWPMALNYNMFLPCLDRAKSANYLHMSRRCAARTIKKYHDGILCIVALINSRPLEIINVYAPNKVEALAFLTTHRLVRASRLAGVFNAHHFN